MSSVLEPNINIGCPLLSSHNHVCSFTITTSIVLIRFITFFIIAGMMFYRLYDIFLRDFMIRIYNEYFSWLINNIESDATDFKFGLWDTDSNTSSSIKEANEKLVQLICFHAGLSNKSKKKKPIKILDVGCGRGATTILLKKELKRRNINCEILAVDTKKINIEYALNNHFHKNIEFLHSKPENLSAETIGKFDLILSLDYAHEFTNRPLFFRKVKSLLEPNGIFINTDFVFEENKYHELFSCCMMTRRFSIFNNMFVNILRKICELVFNIPECNMVNEDIWKKQLDHLFKTKETKNITHESFIPYYNYVIGKNTEKIHGKHTRRFALNLLELICDYQPFECIMGVFQEKKE